MRRFALVTMLLLLPVFVSAQQDSKDEKRELVRELLDVMDSKQLTQELLGRLFTALMTGNLSEQPDMRDDERKQREKAEQMEEMRQFRDRLYAKIDYARFAEEVFAPLIDSTYSAQEIRQLIAFYKTTAGQKSVRLMPELMFASAAKGMTILQGVVGNVSEELSAEQRAARPDLTTMDDLRSVAIAAEAFATDANRYPAAERYEDLAQILSPTYIRKMPERDAWGTPFLYVVSPDGQHYRFVSAGADRRFEWNAKQIEMPQGSEGRAMKSLDNDLIFQDGVFVQFPESSRKELTRSPSP